MVELQQNIMCQDSGKSPASIVCYQPAVAEILVKTSDGSPGKNLLVCQKHFMHPSYPVLGVISCSVTIEKPRFNDDLVVMQYLPAGWTQHMVIRGGKTLAPGEWPMYVVSRKVDTLNKRITEICAIKGEGE